MRDRLPLEVLGLVSPILSWVEGTEGLRFPEPWLVDRLRIDQRERAWLVRELPTYSYDNVDDILRFARGRGTSVDPRPPARRGAGAIRNIRGSRRVSLSPPEGYDLASALSRLGRRYFTWRGSDLCVRAGRLEEVHELAMRFPIAHLVRARHAEAVVEGVLSARRALELPEQLSLLHTASHSLRTLVSRGVHDGHIHLWGVLSGEEFWADHLLRRLGPGVVAGFSPEEERLLVLSRSSVRLLALGVFLLHMRTATREVPFGLLGHLDHLYLTLDRTHEHLDRARLGTEIDRTFTQYLDEEPGGVARRRELDWLLRLISPAAQRVARWSTRRRPSDPALPAEGMRYRIGLLSRLHLEIQRLLMEPIPPVDRRSGVHPERKRQRLHRAFLEQAFFRYLVFQTHFWQLATQSGKTTGLRQFKRFYGARQRRSVDRYGSEEHRLVVERLEQTRHLRIVEGRIEPPDGGPDELVPWIVSYAHGLREDKLDGFGLVVHFIKAEPWEVEGPTASVADQSVRLGRIRRKTQAVAFRLYRLLSTPHPAVPFIVGIDAANLELPTPPEVFAPAFRFLRDRPIEAGSRAEPWERFEAGLEISSLLRERRLGMTYHVGEEFRHLLSGLRAIGEMIEFLGPQPGDRLGHAIALGISPEVWLAQTGYQAVLPRQEWLDTLVWVHHFLGPGHDEAGRLGLVDEIQSQSRYIYGVSDLGHAIDDTGRTNGPSDTRRRLEHDWSPQTLYHAWRLRQLDPYSFDVLDLIERRPPRREADLPGAHHRRWRQVQLDALRRLDESIGSNSAYHLLGLYWHHPDVRRRGRETITVDLQTESRRWLELCGEVQERMQDLVREKQLVVEVNPSSNRLIGPLSRLEDHHVFRMTLDEEHRLSHNLRVTVNTDDPGVFNTSLPHEFYLLGEILLRRGVPEPQVEEWLEWLRVNGRDSSFVRALPAAEDPRVQKILERLEESDRLDTAPRDDAERLHRFWVQRRRRRMRRHRDDRGRVLPRGIEGLSYRQSLR